MASTEQNTKAKSLKPRGPQRPPRAVVKPAPASTEKLKAVVRRLPPNLPEDIFWQSVDEWVTAETVTWKAFYPGKLRKSIRLNKENIPSRAYVAFKTQEQLAVFSQAYDGHLFRDKAGNESQAVVEFAPHQKVPPEKKKVDTRHNTIEQDEDYISFVNSVNAPVSKPSEAEAIEALVASTQPAPDPKSTPLLDALKAEKTAAKDKEAILRNHPHYLHQQETPAIVIAPAKKEEPKKKGGMKSDELPPPPPPLTKKGARAKKVEASKPSSPQVVPTIASASVVRLPNATTLPAKPPISGQPKLPRQLREAASSRFTQPATGNRPTSPAVSTSAPASRPETEQLSTAPAASTAPRERRTRPLMGLQSRQFSAALSGTGVILSPGGGRRREREAKGEVPNTATIVPTDVSSEVDTSVKGIEDSSKDRQPPINVSQAGEPSAMSSTTIQPGSNLPPRSQTPKHTVGRIGNFEESGSPGAVRGARRGRGRGRGGPLPPGGQSNS